MEAKRLLRTGLGAVRAARPAVDRDRLGALLAGYAAGILALAPSANTVAAFAGLDAEPPTDPLLEALRAAGVEVLLPVLPEDSHGNTLDWAPYAGRAQLAVGRWGLRQPTTPRLGAGALATAGVVLVPALAVDRHGIRLGRGGGYYDRVLAAVPVEHRVAVVYDDEVRDTLPAEPHDQPVGWALTPGRGLVRLGD